MGSSLARDIQMENQLLTPPDMAADESHEPESRKQPELLHEADGSMWSSLIGNVRDAFLSPKQPPLVLSSQPVSQDLIITDEPIWTSLANGARDLFFPQKLPPLQLTSTPIAVKDLLAEKRGPMSTFGSVAAHALVFALIALAIWEAHLHARAIVVKKTDLTSIDVKPYLPITPPQKLTMGGGGGGGDHELVQVSKGKLPQIAKQQITPPQVLRVDHPKLAIEPTIVMQPVKLPDANMPNLGMPSSTQVQMASNGTGADGGMGSGVRGGLGSGSGMGFGPGNGQGMGGGDYQVGKGGTTAPVVIYSVEPEFSDEARRAKYEGICNVSVIVDAQGNPQRVHASQRLGMGLDEEAEKAVRQYKFKPAMNHGHPVPVEITVEVNFRIY